MKKQLKNTQGLDALNLTIITKSKLAHLKGGCPDDGDDDESTAVVLDNGSGNS